MLNSCFIQPFWNTAFSRRYFLPICPHFLMEENAIAYFTVTFASFTIGFPYAISGSRTVYDVTKFRIIATFFIVWVSVLKLNWLLKILILFYFTLRFVACCKVLLLLLKYCKMQRVWWDGLGATVVHFGSVHKGRDICRHIAVILCV